MPKKTSKVGVTVEKVIPVKGSKPKQTMFVSGPVQIPAEFSFTKDEFIQRFKGQKLGGKDINKLYTDYAEWCKKNK